jgi:hypothetical protein
VSGTFAGGSDDFLALDVAVTVTAQSSLRMAG